jgi:hypothetical protein
MPFKIAQVSDTHLGLAMRTAMVVFAMEARFGREMSAFEVRRFFSLTACVVAAEDFSPPDYKLGEPPAPCLVEDFSVSARAGDVESPQR